MRDREDLIHKQEKKMANCTNCGTELAEGTKFCPNCGKLVEQVQLTSPVQLPSPAATKQKKKSSKKGCLKIGCLSIVIAIIAIIVIVSVTSKPSYNPMRDELKWKEWGLDSEKALLYTEVNELAVETKTGVKRVTLWIAIKKGKYSKEQLKATAIAALKEFSSRRSADEFGVFIFNEGVDYFSAPSLVEAYLGPNGEWSNAKDRDLKTYSIGYKFL